MKHATSEPPEFRVFLFGTIDRVAVFHKITLWIPLCTTFERVRRVFAMLVRPFAKHVELVGMHQDKAIIRTLFFTFQNE